MSKDSEELLSELSEDDELEELEVLDADAEDSLAPFGGIVESTVMSDNEDMELGDTGRRTRFLKPSCRRRVLAASRCL